MDLVRHRLCGDGVSSRVQEELRTRNDNGEPRCEAATGNAVTLGGAWEVPMAFADTDFSFRF